MLSDGAKTFEEADNLFQSTAPVRLSDHMISYSSYLGKKSEVQISMELTKTQFCTACN